MPSSGARKISLRDGAGRSPRSSLCDNGNPEAFPVYGFFLFFLSRQGKQKTLEGKLRFCGTSGPGRSGGAQFGVSRKRKKKISPCRGCFPCSGICRRKMSFSAFVRKTGGGCACVALWSRRRKIRECESLFLSNSDSPFDSEGVFFIEKRDGSGIRRKSEEKRKRNGPALQRPDFFYSREMGIKVSLVQMQEISSPARGRGTGAFLPIPGIAGEKVFSEKSEKHNGGSNAGREPWKKAVGESRGRGDTGRRSLTGCVVKGENPGHAAERT